MSIREGMIFGGIWSAASVGWMAAILLLVTRIRSDWTNALFWFGAVMLGGAGIFAGAILFALLGELLNITTKRSRRDALNYFSWALLYNLAFGTIALTIALSSAGNANADSP